MKLRVCVFIALVACISLASAQVAPSIFAGVWSGFDTTIISGGVVQDERAYGDAWDPAYMAPYYTSNQVVVSTPDGMFPIASMVMPRAGHTLHFITVENSQILVAFGGNYGWEYFDGQQWIYMDLPEEIQPRFEHDSVIVNDEMIIYGGSSPEGIVGDMWAFSFTTMQWRKIADLQPRWGHTMNYVDGFLLIFGGMDENGETHGDVISFNLGTSKASCLEFPDCEEQPAARTLHTSANYDDGFLIYGGVTNYPSGLNQPFGDLWYFDPAEGWSMITVPPTWAHPQAKVGMTLSSPAEGEYFFFGGADSDFNVPGDIWWFYPEGSFGISDPMWEQDDCLEGYEFPYCQRDCRQYNYCSGHGLCLSNGTCACDAGWEGESCDLNPCDGYRGFSYKELNDILIPKSLESLYVKLQFIQDKLDWIEAHLPALDDECDNEQSPMEILATTSMNFLENCINNELVDNIYGFDYVITCGPCGEDTKCVAGDYCLNEFCVNGTVITSETCRGNDTDMCVIYACDEELGCISSVMDCDDWNACTHDSCDSATGRCVNTPATCDDGDCCTFDSCDPETGCSHTPVCEDFTLCSVESCRYSECEDSPICSYNLIHNCYHSEGQIAGSWDNLPLVLNAINTEVTAEAYFWMFVDTCTLKYQITLPEGYSNEGTHIYGPIVEGVAADSDAGVAGTLEPSGEIESWNFCAANVKAEDLVSGRYYVTAYLRGDNNGMEYALRTGVSLVMPTIN